MKNHKLLWFAFLLFAFGCSSDDNGVIENGTNPIPNLQATGSSAQAFLSADKYTKLAIEIVYVADYKPSDQTIANFRNFMEARLNKPGGITITEREVATTSEAPYSLQRITELETDYRTAYNTPDTLTFFLFFVDGGSTGDGSNSVILGTAYRNTSCVIYENSVQQLSNAINEPNRVTLETTVILHELGHLLGLVNIGSDMQTPHEDGAHLNHCDNTNCLMYYAVESSDTMLQMGNNIPQLDANCLADLAANGGK